MPRNTNPRGNGSYKIRKDGRYQWTQMLDGKVRTLYGKSLKGLKEKVKKVSNLPVTSNKLRLEEWFEKWLEIYVKPLKKPATYNQYKTLYEQHIKPELGFRKLAGIQQYDVQLVIAKMNEKGRASKTMKHVKTVMNVAFNKALDDRLISINPAPKVEIPVRQAKPRKVLSIEDLSKLFKAMKRSRWIWAIKLMLVTGLRRGELLALKWTDIDFAEKRLTVDESNSTTGIGETKSAKVHYVPLSDKAIEYLNGQKAQLQKEHNPIIYRDELMKIALVFPNEEGVMIRPDSFYTMLSRFAKKAEIKASPHCLRHTFVYMTRESMSLKELQAVLGHDESTTTLDIYGDIISDSTIKTAAKIDDVFGKVDEEIIRVEKEKEEKEKAKQKMGQVIEFKKPIKKAK